MALHEFPPAHILWQWWATYRGLDDRQNDLVTQDYHSDGSDKTPRYYQLMSLCDTLEQQIDATANLTSRTPQIRYGEGGVMAGQRHSIRLQGYDYSQAGADFITSCTQNREPLFGDIINGAMRLNDAGRMVQQCWDDNPLHFPQATLDAFVVMPNHIHGIVVIVGDAGAVTVRAKNFSPLPQSPLRHSPVRPRGTSKTIGSIIRGFKIGVTKWMRGNTPVHDVW